MSTSTLFESNGGAAGSGGSSGDYVKDEFLDVSRVASNNTGLTSTALTNPRGYYFADTDSTQYGIKTLFFKDMALIEDRSQWIGNQPTYEVSFTENSQTVRAYCVGNCRLRNYNQGNVLEVRSIGDLIGVSGQIRQIAWIVNASPQATGTASRATDGVVGSNLSFGGAPSTIQTDGSASYNALLHNAVAESNNIHDYRLIANEIQTLQLVGVVVYFQNSGSNIEQKLGSTYLDKALITSNMGASLTPPSVATKLGAKTVAQKSLAGSYSLNTEATPSIESIGVGANATNLIDVTTGQGGSFPIGSHVVGIAGTSFYYGRVTNQSTDTLTVSPTLGFGLSGALYKFLQDGPTIAISASLYQLTHTIDFDEAQNFVNPQAFGVTNGLLNFTDPVFKYRAWGRDLVLSNQLGYPGLGFAGNTVAFLQIDGRYSAAEFEFAAAGILHGTFAINGVPSWGVNSGFSGVYKRTVFSEGGPGWNSFIFNPGQSFVNVAISKINLYERAHSATLGLLSSFDTNASAVPRGSAQNASLMQLGSMQRIYSDSLYLAGDWARGASSAYAGGVGWAGASTNSVLRFQYYGTNFAFVGSQGGSMAATLDGASIAFTFNTLKTAALGFHSVQLTYQAGATSRIDAVDFIPADQMELKSEQNYQYAPDIENVPTVYKQSATPQSAKDGDFWIEQKVMLNSPLPSVWLKLFGLWNKLSFSASVDDPQVESFIRSHGTSGGGDGNGTTTTEIFNGAWFSAASGITSRSQGTGGMSGFSYRHYAIDGVDTGSTITATNQTFNKASWSSAAVRSTARIFSYCYPFNDTLFVSHGSPTGATNNGSSAADRFNGSAWSSGNAWGNGRIWAVGFVVGTNLSSVGGRDTSNNASAVHQVRNLADAVSNSTAMSLGFDGKQSSSASAVLGLITNVADQAATASSYTWNGSAWSSAITSLVTTYSADGNGQGFFAATNGALSNGGAATSGGTPITTSQRFNTIAFLSSLNSGTARNLGYSSVI